jgi:hypothetical protein
VAGVRAQDNSEIRLLGSWKEKPSNMTNNENWAMQTSPPTIPIDDIYKDG